MSCTQVAPEFAKEKFALIYPHPSSFCFWRYTCFQGGRSYPVYRIVLAFVLLILIVLDYLWIIGFDATGKPNRITACFDSSQMALIALFIAYCLLAHSANQWDHFRFGIPVEQSITYKLPWFAYTVSMNAVFINMIIFWVLGETNTKLEGQLKQSIPAFIILIDLCLSSTPLYFCHAFYAVATTWFYLIVCTFGLLLSYMLFGVDKNLLEPGNPTVWIGGQPLLPEGFSDFQDIHRILVTIFGSAALAIVVHSVLLSFVMARDFLSSLFNVNTDAWFQPDAYLSSAMVSLSGQRSASSSSILSHKEKGPKANGNLRNGNFGNNAAGEVNPNFVHNDDV